MKISRAELSNPEMRERLRQEREAQGIVVRGRRRDIPQPEVHVSGTPRAPRAPRAQVDVRGGYDASRAGRAGEAVAPVVARLEALLGERAAGLAALVDAHEVRMVELEGRLKAIEARVDCANSLVAKIEDEAKAAYAEPSQAEDSPVASRVTMPLPTDSSTDPM
jgi:hypothetical protein